MLDLTSGARPDPYFRAGDTLFEAGHNVWRVETAHRAAVLIDGAAYFEAVRAAMLEARDTIHIVGWDLDSRMRLVGPSGHCDDGLPEALAPFLSALVLRRPELRVRLLLWDYSLVFSLQRELTPILSFLWRTPPQIEICLDDVLPLGASHHQKLVVIDDRIAFCGGLDLTTCRWDTPAHRPDDPLRVDAGGAAYPPFHDVQMMVDGPAAAALGELVRARWQSAACEKLPPTRSRARPGDVWPAGIEPDFRDVAVGIARTLPGFGSQEPAAEVVTLFEDMASRAERLVYIENQFVTHVGTARRLCARMMERPELEAIIVVPRSYNGWVERRVMLAGRLRFMRIFEEAGCADRVRLLYPQVSAEPAKGGSEHAAIMVHSKLMIVDDEVLRIGSANLCNRSMGLDSECDLAIRADDEATRRAIAAVRNRLLAEHAGVDEGAISAAIEEGASLCRLLDGLPPAGRRLLPVEDAAQEMDPREAALDAVADPIEPLYEDRETVPQHQRRFQLRFYLKIGAVVAAIALLTLAWRLSPVGDPGKIAHSIAFIADRPWAPLAVILLFLAAEAVAFPVTILIFSTIAVFGGWAGALLAGAGALSSAVVTYLVGRHFGARFVRRFAGPRINRIRRALPERGILAVASVRIVPLAPFTVVNLTSGAIGIRFFDYVVGTALGLLPGLIVLSALGHQIAGLVERPTFAGLALLAGFVALWIVLGLSLQLLVARYRSSG